MIELRPKKKISATTVPHLYSTEFVPKVGQMKTAMNPTTNGTRAASIPNPIPLFTI